MDKLKREKIDACYFKALTLENVGCFGEKQTLELTDERGQPARWTIILGDNAYGKTTLLRSLVGISSYSLTELETMVFGVKGLDWNYRRDELNVAVEAGIAVGYRFAPETKAYKDERRMFSGTPYKWSKDSGSAAAGTTLICHAYGASRRMGKSGFSPRRKDFWSLSLFDDDAPMTNAEDWLLQADYVSSKNEKYNIYKKQVEEIILNLLPEVEAIDYKISKTESKVLFKIPFGWVGLEELSLGYRTMMAWTVDFAAHLFDRYPESKEPLNEPAILLVDEIDLHLHPRWQRTLIDFLTRQFPNTQFIATAHSPLLVQAAAGANLVLLKREENSIVIDNNPMSVQNWRVDQILTSDLFGLPSARPTRTEKLLDEKTRILSKSVLNREDGVRLAEIERGIGPMPFGDTPEEIEADFLIKEVARKIMNSKKSGEKGDHDQNR